jgi:tellurite methyltransferase
MSVKTAPIVKNYLKYANVGKALDIACGSGRNTHYLAEQGFWVDAVDISDYALAQIGNSGKIQTIEADLDSYEIPEDNYDVIIDCNYLDRRLFPQIKAGLKKNGLLIFETFVQSEGAGFHQPSNPDFMLQSNELKAAFSEYNIIKYEEHESENLKGEKVYIASLVARKEENSEQGAAQ